MNVKKSVIKARAKLLRPVLLSGQQIETKIAEVEARAEARIAKLEGLLRAQAETLQRVEKRLINSGVVQLPSGEIMTKIFSGAKMYLDPHDVALVPHLVLDGDWERNVTHAWLKVLREGDVVVDIGANFGYFGVLAAQQTNRKCHIISFEANPNLIPFLRKTFNVNGFDEISSIENVAIADKAGKVTLNILDGYIGSSSLHTPETIKAYSRSIPDINIAAKVDVGSMSLDDYCHDKGIKSLNLIKMDIEGFEENAYQGMRDIVRSSPDLTLFVEFTKEAYADPKRLYEQMLADFGNVFLINEDGSLRKPKHNDYEHVVDSEQADWVMPVFSKKANPARDTNFPPRETVE